MMNTSTIYFILALCWVGVLVSMVMIDRYLWTRSLLPKWKILLGFAGPHTFFQTYIINTRKEYGRIGLWFKLLVISFVVAITMGIIGAIQYANEKGHSPVQSLDSNKETRNRN